MIFRYLHKYSFSRVSDNLKLLNLKIPTSQQQIKTRYRQLAKQYHPDTMKQKVTKQSQDHFVKITTAYNSLKQLQDKQLFTETEDYDTNMPEDQKEKVRTKQEQLRQQTYNYFKKKQFYAQKKKDPTNEKPLHKTIPQLFIGSAFVLILFGQWIYKTSIKTNQQFTEVSKQKEDLIYGNVFKGFNAAKKYSKETYHHAEIITPKEQKNLNF